MEEGLQQEKSTLDKYKHLMHEKGHTHITVTECVFFVSTEHGFLGASPDALVNDPTSEVIDGLAEVKYIQMNDDENLYESLVRKIICVQTNNGDIQLNIQHCYHYQMQQQMFVTRRNWTDFIVAGSNSGDSVFCERVWFSREFWDAIFPKLQSFFSRWIAPEIAYPRIKYGLPALDFRLL